MPTKPSIVFEPTSNKWQMSWAWLLSCREFPKKQVHRSNAVASSVIDYSKLSICIPLMDEILVDLNKNI